MAKTLISGPILALWPKFGPPKIFLKNLARSVTGYHGQLSLCTISEKTNDPIMKKVSDGRTDRQTDGQTNKKMDESDFIRRCPTNIEHPISNLQNHNN